MPGSDVIPVDRVQSRILILRGQRVILDTDLAELYGVTTKRLNEQVRRNADRFPDDFMFRLTRAEKAEVVANCDHLQTLKFSAVMPQAFTEHGAIMAANVVNSPSAIRMSVVVVRAFVQLRQLLSTHRALADKIDKLERHLQTHDVHIMSILKAIRQLMTPPKSRRKKPIGFLTEQEGR